MVSNPTPSPTPHQLPPVRTLEKAQINWPSAKTQMYLGSLLIILSTYLAYGSTIHMNFLLDDYLHLDYAARALHGEMAPLLNNFFSNWGGSDIMKSYRPVVSLSIFIDYLIFHTHAGGYHVSNLIAFSCCSILVSLITLELTGRLGARSGALTAIWAGLLFSVYPLHAESVAWIIGRVDVLATVFYLASLFCFLRLQSLKEKGYLKFSLLFFLLSLTSKEIAVSLPLAIGLLALLPTDSKQSNSGSFFGTIKVALRATLPYLLLLAAFAVFRQLILGTTIGGYGDGNSAGLSIFANKESLVKNLCADQ